MKFGTRRIIFWSFILVFFILAPVLIFYTAGYRYQPNKKRIVKTGTLVVSTIPKQASIIINGKKQDSTTPTVIPALVPDQYKLKLTKPGYLPWEKRLRLKADEAIFISEIQLFKDTLPELVVSGEYSYFSVNPKRNAALLLEKQNKKERLLLASFSPVLTIAPILEFADKNTTIEIINWAPNGNEVLLKIDNMPTLLQVRSSTPKLTSLSFLSPFDIIKFRWDKKTNFLYATNGKQIFKLNLITRQTETTPAVKIKGKNTLLTDFWVNDGKIFELIKYSNKPSELLIVTAQDNKDPEPFILPTAKSYTYLAGNEKTIILLDETKKLTIWNILNEPRLLSSASNISEAMLSNEGEVLYSTSQELWTYNPKTNVRDLLLRTESPLTKAKWHPQGAHILYANNRSLNIIERDNRGTRNEWELATPTSLINYTIDSNSKFLYFVGTFGNMTGLYKREL